MTGSGNSFLAEYDSPRGECACEKKYVVEMRCADMLCPFECGKHPQVCISRLDKPSGVCSDLTAYIIQGGSHPRQMDSSHTFINYPLRIQSLRGFPSLYIIRIFSLFIVLQLSLFRMKMRCARGGIRLPRSTSIPTDTLCGKFFLFFNIFLLQTTQVKVTKVYQSFPK